MRIWLLMLLACLVQAQSSVPAKPKNSESKPASSAQAPAENPKLAPPRSDGVNVNSVSPDPGESSSKADPMDLSPPADDTKAHPQSSDILMDEGTSGDAGDIHPWNPHKAAKDVEVGDFYFKRKSYAAAESRYREALLYKDNDAIATYRLAVCLEKMERPDEARAEYESYLKILPYGPEAADAKKAIERLKSPSANAKGAK